MHLREAFYLKVSAILLMLFFYRSTVWAEDLCCHTPAARFNVCYRWYKASEPSASQFELSPDEYDGFMQACNEAFPISIEHHD